MNQFSRTSIKLHARRTGAQLTLTPHANGLARAYYSVYCHEERDPLCVLVTRCEPNDMPAELVAQYAHQQPSTEGVDGELATRCVQRDETGVQQ